MHFKHFACSLIALASVATACAKPTPQTLSEARQGFETQVWPSEFQGDPVPVPPEGVFELIQYPATAGELAAYLTPDPRDGKRHPAIIWMTGGDSNSIGELWEPAPRSNDQTAAAFRQAGIVLMFPSLRGGNDNPGVKEGFLGEVDDILAAAEHLASLPWVDPQRIYLGGHSTGGTLVLLVAENSARFRATFAFGPVDEVEGYGQDYLPFDLTLTQELKLRSPIHWLDSIRAPVFVFEGTESPTNLGSLQALDAATENPMVQFLPVSGADHFSTLAPTTELIAKKILLDRGAKTSIRFARSELMLRD